MAQQLTAEDARQSLNAHVAAKGSEIHAKYGPDFGWAALQQLLTDRDFVRYPCEISFDPAALLPGEFAHPVPNGEAPESGFVMHVHPLYLAHPADIALLVLYQLVAVNYGEFASHEDAETFAAAALGMSREDYYRELCLLADRLDPAPEMEAAGGCSGSGNHGCTCASH